MLAALNRKVKFTVIYVKLFWITPVVSCLFDSLLYGHWARSSARGAAPPCMGEKRKLYCTNSIGLIEQKSILWSTPSPPKAVLLEGREWC